MSSDAEEFYLKNYTTYGTIAYDELDEGDWPEEDYDPYLEAEQIWESENGR